MSVDRGNVLIAEWLCLGREPAGSFSSEVGHRTLTLLLQNQHISRDSFQGMGSNPFLPKKLAR
jgi:hypothetical protein